ncbi:MAG TPA: tripartite tricarboxylate transporter substrate-binding protein [Xanthobacteraceae bacterium]|nr:tripartite tricarboxylate transporter substrate-binding protein [Xanthobacteraceae bacterium]
MSKTLPFALLAAAFAAASLPASAADYYAGKTIEWTVGGDAGGGYDIYSRSIARHLPKYIPGSPNIIVKNLPGAGSAKAATFIATQAAKDGTAIGMIFPGAIVGPLLEDGQKPQYDATKFVYLATADSGTRVCATFHTANVKSFADAQKQKAKMGASQAGGSTRDYVNMLRKSAGAQFELVTGYKGTAEIGLAVERGEVDGLCGWDWSSLKSQKSDWLRDKKINILLQTALEPEPELAKLGVPTMWEFIKNEDDKKAAELVVSQQVFGRPFIAPPGTNAEAVKILREAFSKVMQDKDFLADAEKAKIDINPLDGAKVQDVVTKVYASPPAVVARAKELIKE